MRGVTRIHLPTSTFPVASLSVWTNFFALLLLLLLLFLLPCHLRNVLWIGITLHVSLETDIARKFVLLDSAG